jgi:membrane-associated phospholipid phosphatase
VEQRPRAGALAAVAAFSALGVLLAYALWVRTRTGQRLDQAAFNGGAISRRAHDASGVLLSTISIGSLALAIAVLAALALLRQRRTLAIVAIAGVGGAVLTTEVLKLVIFERPPLYPSPRGFGNTYPSGHTTIAYAVGLAAVMVSPRRIRRLVAAAAFAYGTGIGLSTILAGWHRPSDVVGGLLVATAWIAGTVALVAASDRDAFAAGRAGMRSELVAARNYAILGTAVLALGWLAAVAIVVGERAGRLDLSHANGAFVLAAAAIVAFAAAVFAVLLLALRPVLPRD